MKFIVKAKPSARENKVEKIDDNNYIVSVKEPPVQGKANRAIIEQLADYFNIPTYKIRIVAGHTSRNKIIEINN